MGVTNRMTPDRETEVPNERVGSGKSAKDLSCFQVRRKGWLVLRRQELRGEKCGWHRLEACGEQGQWGQQQLRRTGFDRVSSAVIGLS